LKVPALTAKSENIAFVSKLKFAEIKQAPTKLNRKMGKKVQTAVKF